MEGLLRHSHNGCFKTLGELVGRLREEGGFGCWRATFLSSVE